MPNNHLLCAPTKVVKALMGKSRPYVDESDQNGLTASHWCASQEKYKHLSILINHVCHPSVLAWPFVFVLLISSCTSFRSVVVVNVCSPSLFATPDSCALFIHSTSSLSQRDTHTDTQIHRYTHILPPSLPSASLRASVLPRAQTSAPRTNRAERHYTGRQ